MSDITEPEMFSMPGAYAGSAKGIRYNDRYSIFINPYPIFERHFTVPSRHHEPQCIGDDLKTCWISLSIFRGIPYFITVPLAALLPRTIFTFNVPAASYAFGRRCRQ